MDERKHFESLMGRLAEAIAAATLDAKARGEINHDSKAAQEMVAARDEMFSFVGSLIRRLEQNEPNVDAGALGDDEDGIDAKSPEDV
jgi:hypothetical protein